VKIRTKLFLFALLCSIVPLVTVFSLSFNVVNESLSRTIKETLQARAIEELDTLQTKLADAKHELISLSMLSNMQNVRAGGDVYSLQTDIDRFANRKPLFTEILVVNYSGKVVAGSIPEYIDYDLSGTWEFEAPKLGIQFEGPVVRSNRLNKNLAVQSATLYTDSIPTAITGALIGSIDWEILKADLASKTLFGGQQDKKRLVFLESMASQLTDRKILYGTQGIPAPTKLFETAIDDGEVKSVSLYGKEYMMVTIKSRPYNEFRDPNWRLHLLLDSDIAYAGVINLKNIFLLSALAILCLITGISYLLSRSIVNPVNSLVTSAEKLSSGDYDDELKVAGAHDEIGQLTRSFDAMRMAVKQNEEELVKKTTAAEQAAKLKGEFLANMSHEVRTPINGVLGMTELLLNTPLEEKQIRYAETISRSGQALLSVINDILDFSKIEAGKLELTEGAFDLRLLTEDIVEMLVDTAHRKGVEVILDIPPGSHVAFSGDANRLRQILINLIGNAIKFTNEGQVKISLSFQEMGNSKTVIKFSVEDTGIGVPLDQQKSIFESFVQADGTTTRNFGGTGLGLTISAKLAELMEGNIGMKSKPGKGSIFWFTVSLNKLSSNVEKAWQSGEALNEKHVLIVDDNEANREILDEQTKYWGATSVAVNSGAKALIELERAKKKGSQFDIAILDMQMPYMSGLELVECIEKNSLAKNMRIVLLSSTSEHELTNCHNKGISSVAVKPIRQLDLYNSLTAVCTSDRSQSLKSVARKIKHNVFEGHVLIVEDNPVNQDMMLEMLGQLGATAILANNGEDALKAVSKYKFDVILMDCQMPIMDGFEATRAIRLLEQKSTRQQHIPIVALTANALEGDRERCLECGMDEYMSKPVSYRTLQNTLSPWLSRTPLATSESSEPTLNENGILDESIFHEIYSMCSNASPGFYNNLLQKYRDASIEDINILKSAIESKDGNLIGATSHRLKSSSISWGGRAMADACQLLENAGKDNQLTDADQLLDQIIENQTMLLDVLENRAQKAA